jgi:hypothetical protein
MARPTGTLPTFATDTNFTGGGENGLAVKAEPAGAVLAQGHRSDLAWAARYENWWKNKVGAFISYLNGLATDAEFLANDFAWTGDHTFVAGTSGEVVGYSTPQNLYRSVSVAEAQGTSGDWSLIQAGGTFVQEALAANEYLFAPLNAVLPLVANTTGMQVYLDGTAGMTVQLGRLNAGVWTSHSPLYTKAGAGAETIVVVPGAAINSTQGAFTLRIRSAAIGDRYLGADIPLTVAYIYGA